MSRQRFKGPKRLSKKLANFCKLNNVEVKALTNSYLDWGLYVKLV